MTGNVRGEWEGTLRGDGNPGEPARQALANFARSPAGVFTLHIENVVLDLKGELVGVAIRTSAAIGESMNAAFLVPIDDLVAGPAGDPKTRGTIPPSARQPADERQTASSRPSPNTPPGIVPPLSREGVLPMCPVQTVTYLSGRSKTQRSWAVGALEIANKIDG
jgi:hypothetical protein